MKEIIILILIVWALTCIIDALSSPTLAPPNEDE
jgi:hypothetical protein